MEKTASNKNTTAMGLVYKSSVPLAISNALLRLLSAIGPRIIAKIIGDDGISIFYYITDYAKAKVTYRSKCYYS